MKIDYYGVLGVSQNASEETIRTAYKKLAEKWHPKNHTKDQHTVVRNFGQVSEAYQILSHPKWRSLYDKKCLEARHRGSEYGVEEAQSDTKTSKQPATAAATADDDISATAMGRNVLVSTKDGRSRETNPNTLLGLRSPFRVYDEMVNNAQPDTSDRAYCEQLVQLYLRADVDCLILTDVLGNRTEVCVAEKRGGKKTINVLRNRLVVDSITEDDFDGLDEDDDSSDEEDGRRAAALARMTAVKKANAPLPPPAVSGSATSTVSWVSDTSSKDTSIAEEAASAAQKKKKRKRRALMALFRGKFKKGKEEKDVPPEGRKDKRAEKDGKKKF